ncbi:MAG: precorrin-8X methylmutase [Pyramidobacter sp.]
MKPEEIELASMKTIAAEMAPWQGTEEELPVVMRVIHATADFEFQRTLRFSPDVVNVARAALKRGTPIVTDTMMAAAGISKKACSALGVTVTCRMSAPAIAEEARARGVTRAIVSMEAAARQTPGAIYVIGNAPTALIRLCELIDEKKAAPALVVGVPVGFVNVVESKERLARTDVPSIIAMGRKGGSTVASAILNALLYGIVRP